MVLDLTKLKEIRIKLGATQNQFAHIAGVSQSLVAKIESGRLDPSYSNVVKIEHAIALLKGKKEKEAKDIMTKKAITASPDEQIESVIKLMAKHSISQVPILDKEKIIGLVTEGSILEKKGKTTEKCMIEAPPIVTGSTKFSVIKALLEFYPIIAVEEKGRLVGVVTKADLIKHM